MKVLDVSITKREAKVLLVLDVISDKIDIEKFNGLMNVHKNILNDLKNKGLIELGQKIGITQKGKEVVEKLILEHKKFINNLHDNGVLLA